MENAEKMFNLATIKERFNGLLVIGDVHGEADAFFEHAAVADKKNLFLVGLGDFTDRGPNSPSVMAEVIRKTNDGTMGVIVGNHDDKLWRHLNGNGVKIAHGLDTTLEQLDDEPDGATISEEWHKEMPDWPLWATMGNMTFVHGAFHPVMLETKFLAFKDKKGWGKIASRALFGQVAGFKEDGLPIRVHDWVNTIPNGHTVFVGHEVVSTNDIIIEDGALGGKAIFMDTGSGKNGKLSGMEVFFE